MKNRICELFDIDFPIIQAGMVWCSGWRLAAAVSNAGGLGILGAGSMTPKVLDEHIVKYKNVCDKPFAVNLPLLYPYISELIDVVLAHKVPIVFTSAGNPKTWTLKLKNGGCKVAHVVSSKKFALKAQNAGVDAVVAEGFEAGGHNGREETTTLCLIPDVCDAVSIPVIAAGGIASGKATLAVMVLGAEAVQIGTRFAVCEESSAHAKFKEKVLTLDEGQTKLMLKQLAPVRLIKNVFSDQVHSAELNGASIEELRDLLGRGRSRKGIFEGDMENGELEIGQVGASLQKMECAKDIVKDVWKEFLDVKKRWINA